MHNRRERRFNSVQNDTDYSGGRDRGLGEPRRLCKTSSARLPTTFSCHLRDASRDVGVIASSCSVFGISPVASSRHGPSSRGGLDGLHCLGQCVKPLTLSSSYSFLLNESSVLSTGIAIKPLTIPRPRPQSCQQARMSTFHRGRCA